ncbi:hypothetical protein [uncultured Jannaschia sp.]|uniref:hypothetical protein n=1 Tax=uncultured Jannaschia sp. TaxID=293347 RepID=UPI00261D5E10|nr:hypothetical protein [uncultured Jannaschia sp.]
MIALLRLVLMIVVGLTVIAVCLWFWCRAGARDRLEAEWARTRPPLPLHRYVKNGLDDRKPRLIRRLILGVYVAPITLLAVLVWTFN